MGTSGMKLYARRFFCLCVIVVVPLMLTAQSFVWQDISGVPGCFALRRGMDGTVFAASEGSPGYTGAVYKSLDRGMTWTATSVNYGLITQLETRGSRVLTSRFVLNSSPTYQVFLSADNGSTWNRILGDGFNSILDFIISDSGTVYGIINPFLPGGGALAKYSANRWRQTGVPFLTRGVSTTQAMDRASNFYVGTQTNGLFISTNFGTSWINLLSPRSITAINVEKETELLLGASPTSVISGGVFTSSDTGKTWQLLGLAQNSINGISRDSTGTIFAATSAGVYRYRGMPNQWDLMSPISGAVSDVLSLDGQHLVAISTSQGMFTSGDGGTVWNQNGIRDEDVSSVLAPAGNTIYLGTLGHRLFVSKDAGLAWKHVPADSICDYVFSLAYAGGNAFAGTECGVFRSTDQGTSWSNVSEADVAGGSFALATSRTGVIYNGTNFGVYRSEDAGIHWTPAGFNNEKISSLAVGQNDELVCAGPTSGISASSNGGTTWQSLGLVRNDVQCVSVSLSGTVIVGIEGGVVISADRGTTWQEKYFSSGYVYSLVSSGTNLVAATGSGVFVSADEGMTWSLQNSGIKQPIVLSVAVTPAGNLLAGTYNGGLYRSDQTITGVTDDVSVPVTSALLHNYPNPFNPSTNIRFQIGGALAGDSRPEHVSLNVYDVLGRQVATLLNENLMPGMHTISWDATSSPNGIYFALLRITNGTYVTKMLLMK